MVYNILDVEFIVVLRLWYMYKFCRERAERIYISQELNAFIVSEG